jgi:hypothetical protein
MIKKILIIAILIFSFWLNWINYSSAEWSALDWLRERCEKKWNWSGKINCPQFTIDAWDFSPWSKKILDTARKWDWDSVKTTNLILGTIIKNLIVVFWVLSLLMMTIGWGMMIFHAGQESILTKWKSIFMYWIISLVVWLSAWIIVQVVSYFLY